MFLALVWLIVGIAVYMLSKKSDKDRNYPPGPWELPIIGSLWRLDQETPHLSLKRIAEKYSKSGACRLHLGNVETLLLTDPRLVREAFASEKFAGRAPLFLTHGIMKGHGIICAEGDLWKDQRKLMVAWFRNIGAHKTSQRRNILERRIMVNVDKLIKKLHVLEKDGKSVDIVPIMSNFMGLTTISLVLGATFDDENPTWKWLQHIQEEAARAIGVAGAANFLPFLRFFSKTIRKTMDVMNIGLKQTHHIYESCIEIRRAMRRIRRDNSDAKINFDDILKENTYKDGIKCYFYALGDVEKKEHLYKPTDLRIIDEECFADYFIDEQEARFSQDPDSDGSKRLSETQFHFFLADLFGAGLDTTLYSTLWFIVFMCLYPEEQEKVRNEILSVCGERSPGLDDLPQLVYTRAAMYESQRLRSVVPLGVPHGCVQDTTVGDFFVKKGTMVIPFIYSIHTDSKIWDDPFTFSPSRFIGDNHDVLSPTEFIPFQTGKRMCPGDELARMSMFLYASNILSKFKLSFDGIPSPLEGEMGITLQTPHYKVFLKSLK